MNMVCNKMWGIVALNQSIGAKQQFCRYMQSRKKYINQRQDYVKGQKKVTLMSVVDQSIALNSKKEVIDNTHAYYTDTGKAKHISDDTTVNYLQGCKDTVEEPTQKSMEVLCSLISFFKVVIKIFSTTNNTVLGRDRILYELLKVLPECFFKVLTHIFNIMLTKEYYSRV